MVDKSWKKRGDLERIEEDIVGEKWTKKVMCE